MIHLVIREPTAYQRTLCQTLSDSYKGALVAWFAERTEELEPHPLERSSPFKHYFLRDVGYAKLRRELKADLEATVILGGWSSAMAYKTLLIAMLLRVPVLIWADHPHPRKRSWLFTRLRKIYLSVLARRAAAFLACGNPTVEHLANLGISRQKIFNFPYWVELPEAWSPPERCLDESLTNKPLRLIAIGRHVPVKAFDVAISAVGLANQGAGLPVAELVMVGDGPERGNLERLVESLDLKHIVRFTGWLDNQEVYEQLRNADAVIITSEFEAYGVVVLEALAHGRPVLACNRVMGALDKDDGFGAILFHASGDARRLAQQIKMLAEDRNAIRMASEVAREIAETWPPKRAVEILQSVFERTVSGIRVPRRDHVGRIHQGIARDSAEPGPHSLLIYGSHLRTLAREKLKRPQTGDAGPQHVTGMQWILASVSVIVALTSYETSSYATLAAIAQVLVGLNSLLLVIVTREVLRTKTIGKFCLVAGVFVFYWLDALALSLQLNPFSVPENFPLSGAQFDQELIQQALVYVSVFQLLLFVGYSVRPALEQPVRFLTSRVDSLSFDRTLIAVLLVMCSLTPLLVYYDFDVAKIVGALLASRSGTEFESPEPGLAQHVALFGIYGASLFFVYALKAATWRRFWWLALGVIAAAPFVLGGTRHIWLYISLPSVLIVLRGFKGKMSQHRVVALTVIALVVLVVAQAQFVYRSVGWKGVEDAPVEELSQFNTNGQLTALLFAEYLVPAQHAYFMEPVEPYFLIHWVPRQIWPTKPVMESWAFYNDSYVEGGAFNVTPSVIGQFHLNWGLPGVLFVGVWLGFLTFLADRVLILIDSDRQRAMFVVVGMFYAFIISSFRFYSPIYFSYFFFGVIAMFLLTRRRESRKALVFKPHQLPA